MRLSDVQKNAKELSEKHGWDKSFLSDRVEHLKEELEELLEALGNYSTETNPKGKAELKRLVGHESFDVIWNVANIANYLELDLEHSAREKIEINDGRVWQKGAPNESSDS